MKKIKIFFSLCITIALSLIACNDRGTSDVPAGVPMETQAPAETGVPVVTDVPKETTVPEVIMTPLPTSTPTPTLLPTATPVLPKTYTFTFSQTECLLAHSCSYEISEDGAITMQYNAQYSQVMLVLPEAVDMLNCSKVTVRAKSEYGNLSVKLFDETVLSSPWNPEVFVRYDCIGDGVVEYELYPKLTSAVWGIGLMGVDAVQDYSAYTATVYSVTFHMSEEEKSAVPKDIAPDVTEDMTLLNTYGTVFDYIGTAVSVKDLRQPAVLAALKEQYNSITLENDMKADALFTGAPKFISVEEAKQKGYRIPENYKEETVPMFFFKDVDEVLEICGENGLGMRSIPLVWNYQTPTWFFRENYSEEGTFVSPEVMDARLEFYIWNVMGHVYDHKYGEVVYAWDVVNEYLHSGVNDSDWLRVYGEQGLEPEFVKLAYRVADEVLCEYGIREKVTLLYNDYNTFDGSMPSRMLSLVEFINADGVICDGIGMQTHMDVSFPRDRSVFSEAVRKFLDAGLAVHITELDITIKNPTAKSEESQRKFFGQVFRDLLEIKRNGGDISSVTFWGMSDSVSWLGKYSPLLFKTRSTPKDAYYEVLQVYVEEK